MSLDFVFLEDRVEEWDCVAEEIPMEVAIPEVERCLLEMGLFLPFSEQLIVLFKWDFFASQLREFNHIFRGSCYSYRRCLLPKLVLVVLRLSEYSWYFDVSQLFKLLKVVLKYAFIDLVLNLDELDWLT